METLGRGTLEALRATSRALPRPSAAFRARWWVNPALALAALLLSATVAEVGLRLAAPVVDPYEYRKNPRTNNYIDRESAPGMRVALELVDTELPGLRPRGMLTTNNRGFRGDRLVEPKPANEYRIFIVGGSTAETFALDDADALNAVLQRSLQPQVPGPSVVKVFNAGASGQWSAGHVSVVVHRLVHLEPDMIIVFAGINDLRAAINELDYLHYESEQHYGPWTLLKMLASEFQLFRRMYYLATNTRPRQARVDGVTKIDYRPAIAERLAAPVSDRSPRTDVGPYVRNLETIAGVAKAHGIQLVFVTQQTTWNSDVDSSVGKRQWMLFTNGVRYRADLMDAALRQYNDAMKAVGKKLSVPVYDLASVLPKSGEYIYDDVHFGVQGALTMGRGLAAFIHCLGLMDTERPRSHRCPGA